MHKILDLLFKNQTTKQTVLKNTFWLTFSNFSGRAIRAIIVIYGARVLGAEGYGIFSYALGFAALFGIVGDFGMDILIVREASKKEGAEKDKIISAAFYFKSAIEILSYGALLLVALKLAPIEQSKPLIPFLGLSLLFDAMRQFGFAIIKAAERMEVEAGIYMLHQIATVLFGLGALIIWKTPLSLAIAYMMGSAVGFLLVTSYLKNIFKKLIRNFDMRVLRLLLKDAWPYAFLMLAGVLLVNMDTVMLGWFTSAENVGYYGAATKPIQILFSIPSFLAAAILPILSRNVDVQKKTNIVGRSVGGVLFFGIPLTVGGFLLSDFIISTLYGNAYIPAVVPFQMLIFVVLLNFPTTVMGVTILSHNKQIEMIKYLLWAALVNAALNYYFIPLWDLRGAAFATLLSQSIATIGYYLVAKKIESFSFASYLKTPLLASAAMGILIFSLRTLHVPLLIVMGAGTVAYIIFTIFLKDPLFQEIREAISSSGTKNMV